MNRQRLMAIIVKEFIHIKRDRASLLMAIFMPVVFILLFGYAVNMDVNNVEMAVLDMDKTMESREFIDTFKNSNYFRVNYFVDNVKDLEFYIDLGDVKAGMIIENGFSNTVQGYGEKKVQVIIDGVDSTIARTALQNVFALTQSYNKNLIAIETIERVDVRTRVWYNPNLESSKFTVPGLIGLVMQNITVMLTAFALVREKESGTIELLIVTPIKSSELILGKMIPYVFIGLVDFLLALGLGTVWFNVPIQGSLVLMIVLGLFFVICSLAIGMLISNISTNQTQAMQMSLLFILPSVLLSGFVFPRESMPFFIKMIGNVVPLTYFLKIIRGIILKGVGLEYLYRDTVSLIIFSVVLLGLAIIKFKKKLD